MDHWFVDSWTLCNLFHAPSSVATADVSNNRTRYVDLYRWPEIIWRSVYRPVSSDSSRKSVQHVTCKSVWVRRTITLRSYAVCHVLPCLVKDWIYLFCGWSVPEYSSELKSLLRFYFTEVIHTNMLYHNVGSLSHLLGLLPFYEFHIPLISNREGEQPPPPPQIIIFRLTYRDMTRGRPILRCFSRNFYEMSQLYY
jgi:hypothetical protein